MEGSCVEGGLGIAEALCFCHEVFALHAALRARYLFDGRGQCPGLSAVSSAAAREASRTPWAMPGREGRRWARMRRADVLLGCHGRSPSSPSAHRPRERRCTRCATVPSISPPSLGALSQRCDRLCLLHAGKERHRGGGRQAVGGRVQVDVRAQPDSRRRTASRKGIFREGDGWTVMFKIRSPVRDAQRRL